jgi:UDP-2-acetamido-2-deoxy-ribo-hexuluronate aminotransferase
LQEALKTASIPTAVHYPVPLHQQPAYASRCRIQGSLAVAERLAERVISLPMGPDLREEDQDRVIAEVLRVLAPVAA